MLVRFRGPFPLHCTKIVTDSIEIIKAFYRAVTNTVGEWFLFKQALN